MKKTVCLILFSILLLPQAIWADQEIEIEFRLQPDRTGNNTRNQGIKVDGDAVEVYLDGDEWEVNGSTVDSDGLFKLVAREIKAFEFVEGKKVRPPYVEVKMEFSGEDREIEISRSYPAGKVPKDFVQLQEKYLKEVWE